MPPWTSLPAGGKRLGDHEKARTDGRAFC